VLARWLGAVSRVSLRTLLIGGAVAMAVVFAVALGVGSLGAVRDRVVADTLERNEMLARGLAAAFDQFLALHLAAVKSAAAEIGPARRLDTDALVPILARFRTHHPAFVGIAVTGADGVVVASDPAMISSGRTAIGFDLSDRAWFRDLRAKPEATVDRRVLMAHVRPTPIVTVNAPLLDARGTMRGAVSAALDIDAVDRIAAAVKIGITGYAQVAAADGILLVHPRRDWVQERKDYSTSPIWAHVTRADAGRVPRYIGSLGDVRIAGFATVPGVGWKIWVTQALTDVESDVWRAYRQVLGWHVVTLALVGIVATFVALAIVTPVRRLQVRASAIARGRLVQHVPEHGPAEIAALARAFNEMGDALARREAELRASETRYRVLFERSFAGIYRVRPDGTMLQCNEAFARILGHRSPEDACRRNAREFYADADVLRDVLRRLAEVGSIADVEVGARRRDGSVVLVSLSARVIEEQGATAYEGTLIDLTDRKRAEEATALRSVAELANAAAHELNNPLAVVVGELDLLERGAYDRGRIERASAAVQRMQEIVAHMTRITRLEQAQGWPSDVPPMLDIRRSGGGA
jgi:PAS domain S-box-containing protein